MKKKITAIALSTVMVISMTVGVSAANKRLYEKMDLDSLLKASEKGLYTYKINALDKENAEPDFDDLKDKIDEYKKLTQYEYQPNYYENKLKLLELENEFAITEFEFNYLKNKDSADKKALQYKLQSEYNNLYLLDSKLKSVNSNLKYLDKLFEIEKVKLSQERSTDINVSICEMDVKLAKTSVKQIENEKLKIEHSIANMLNEYDNDEYCFVVIKPELPELTLTEANVIKNFFDKNYDYTKQKKQLEADQKYLKEVEKIFEFDKDNEQIKKLKNTVEISKLEFEIAEENYKLYISNKFIDYTTALYNRNVYLKYRTTLSQKLSLLETSFKNGNISEIDYIYQKADIQAALYDCDNADIALVNVINEISLLNEGMLL